MAQFLILTLIGGGLFLLGWWQRRKYRASLSWPAVPGRIISAAVAARTTRGDQDNPDSTSFYPDVEYEYQAGAQTLRGRTIAVEERGYASRKQAEKALAAMAPGAAVEVYYDPQHPSSAVLERRASTGVIPLAVGGVIVALALLSAFVR